MRTGRLLRILLLLTLATGVLAPVPGEAGPAADVAALAPYIAVQPVASGLQQPVFITHAGDGSERLFISERAGRIRILSGGTLGATPFLDIRSKVASGGGEQGLLGLAFHPDFGSNGQFFIYYTNLSGGIVVARYQVSGDPDLADAASESILLAVPKSATNHNGGMLAFGPDGYLYVATGDGGGAGDPNGNAQSLTTLLGKILRLDVDAGTPYAIPSDNPLASSGDPAVRKEIWAFGLRNPWRFSIDRQTGDVFIADVGQGAREEIDFQSASSTGGANYGWRGMEGSLCYNPSSDCDRTGLTLPVAEYDHGSSGGCSVTGGYVYRGQEFAQLNGIYLYGDYCSGRIWGLERTGGGAWQSALLLDTDYNISSFGEDQVGEVYFTDLSSGQVLRIVALAFADVPYTHWARANIEALYNAGFVAGCSAEPRLYCPENVLSRAESAVFVERGLHGAIPSAPYPPPASPTFADVPTSFWGYGWIESLWQDGMTAGCNTDPLAYCPGNQHTRAEASVFFLRIKNGATYTPPTPTGLFTDVPLEAWFAGWVE
ncbi:MAG: PQQ-dependent sugar dehydrogenase, partial [Anaerolineales bacterium]|nr:PQQ-dependent sugar dehydrogenase [Anaerolineales bacterium]